MKLSILIGLSFALVAHALPGRYPLSSKKETDMTMHVRDESGKSHLDNPNALKNFDFDHGSDRETDFGLAVPEESLGVPQDLDASDDWDEDEEILGSLKDIYMRLKAKMAYSSHDRPVIRRRWEGQGVEEEPTIDDQVVTKAYSTTQASPAGRMGGSSSQRIPLPERPVT